MLLLFFNKLLHLFTREHTRLQLRTTSTPWRKQPSQRRVTMLLNSCQFTRCLKQLCQMRHLNHLPKRQLEIAVAKRRTAIDVSQKGHVREDCDAEMYCDICDCIEHFTSRCPKFRGDKPCAIPCGYAVEGLGFYHIPQSVTPQQRSDPRAAVIRVTDGTLTIPNVISELERLIPGKWKWNVESGGNSNTFKTLFP